MSQVYHVRRHVSEDPHQRQLKLLILVFFILIEMIVGNYGLDHCYESHINKPKNKYNSKSSTFCLKTPLIMFLPENKADNEISL